MFWICLFTNGYCLGGLVFAFITTFIHMGAGVLLQIAHMQKHYQKSSPARMQECIQKAINQNAIGPGMLENKRHHVHIFPLVRGLPPSRSLNKEERQKRMKEGVAFFFLGLAIWVGTVQALSTKSVTHSTFALGMAVTVICYACVIHYVLIDMVGNTYWGLLVFFAVVAIGLTTGGSQEMVAGGVEPLMVP